MEEEHKQIKKKPKGPQILVKRPEMINEDSEDEDSLSIQSKEDPLPKSLRRDAPLNDSTHLRKVRLGEIKPNTFLFSDGIIGAYFKHEKKYTPAQISVK